MVGTDQLETAEPLAWALSTCLDQWCSPEMPPVAHEIHMFLPWHKVDVWGAETLPFWCVGHAYLGQRNISGHRWHTQWYIFPTCSTRHHLWGIEKLQAFKIAYIALCNIWSGQRWCWRMSSTCPLQGYEPACMHCIGQVLWRLWPPITASEPLGPGQRITILNCDLL